MANKLGQPDGQLNNYCDPCYEIKEEFVPPLGLCSVCEVYLCTACKAMHDQFPVTRNHKILTGSECPPPPTEKMSRLTLSSGDRVTAQKTAKSAEGQSTVPEIKPRESISRKPSTSKDTITAPETLKPTAADLKPVTDSESSFASVPEASSIIDRLNIKVNKQGSFNVKVKDDKKECWITGIAITKGGKRLIVDNLNEKLKVFSKDMKFLSALSLDGEPWDVSDFGEFDAVLSVPEEQKLHIVDISANKPRIKQTLNLTYRVYGVAICKDSIIVACPYTSPPSVKMIDKKGKTVWSVDSSQGQQLFTRPWYVCMTPGPTKVGPKSPLSSIIVTDCDFHLVNPRLALLDSSKGKIMGVRKMESKNPYGITMNESKSEYVFVCNSQNEVAVMSKDLTEERVILTDSEGISGTPQAMVYDSAQNSLLVSYSTKTRSQLDCFQIKF